MKKNALLFFALMLITASFSAMVYALDASSTDTNKTALQPAVIAVINYGEEFKLSEKQSGSVENYKITLNQITTMQTLNSCVQGAYCPPAKPVKSAELTISKTEGGMSTATTVWLNEGASAKAFELKITNNWIDSSAGTASFTAIKNETPPEAINVSLGAEFKLLENQRANVQKNNATVLKLVLQRIDQTVGCSMEGPCLSNTYAVFTASDPSLGMSDFKVKLNESETVGNFTVYFARTNINTGEASLPYGVFIVKELPQSPEGIYVNLGVPFDILLNQTAKTIETGFKAKLVSINICPQGSQCLVADSTTLEVSFENSTSMVKLYSGKSAEISGHLVTLNSFNSKSANLTITQSTQPPKPVDVTAYLNQKFSLSEKQAASVFSGKCAEGLECRTQPLMKVKLVEIMQYKCAESADTSTSSIVKCMGGKTARVQLSAENSTGTGGTEIAAEITMSKGQTTSFNGYELTLLDLLTLETYPAQEKAVFIAREPSSIPDYKKVELNQKFALQEKEKAMIAGENVIVRLNGIYQGAGIENPVSSKQGIYSAPAFEIRSQPSHRVWLKFEKGKGKILSAQFAPESANCFDIHMQTYGEPVCKEGTELAQGTECRYYLQRNTWGEEGKKCVLQITYEDGGSVRTSNFESTGTMHLENIYEISELPKTSYANVSVWKQPSIYANEKEIESAKEFNYNLKTDESLNLYGLNISLLGINGSSSATFIATKQQSPKAINVHINELFKLSPDYKNSGIARIANVLEANLRIEALSIASVCQSCPAGSGEAAPSCEGSCSSQVTFSVSNYAFGIEEIANEVSPSIIKKTAVSSTDSNASGGSEGGVIAPKPWKQYTLSAGESIEIGKFEIRVSDISLERAVFEVVNKATGLKAHYVIKEGFNLFSLPGTIEGVSSNCESSNFKIFQYMPGSKPPWNVISSPQNGIAYWIFNSGKSCEATGIVREATPLASIPSLVKGWNFVAIVPEMIGSKINELGSCNGSITRAFYWNASSKMFEKTLNRTINESDLGKAFAVYSTSACSLGEIETPEMPPMPSG